MSLFVTFGLVGVILHALSEYIFSPPWSNVFGMIGFACYAIAAAGLLDAVADRLGVSIYSLTDAVVRILNPDIVMAEKVATMDADTAAKFMAGMPLWNYDWGTQEETYSEMGRVFTVSNFVRYIEKHDNVIWPNALPLERHGHGTARYMDEQAMQSVLTREKMILPRDGQVARWLKPIDEVLVHFGFDEVAQ